MRVLLTGGTGFIGQRLGLELVRQGHEVIALVRDIESAQKNLIYPAELYLWSVTESLSDVDAVIHLAGESIAKKRWCPKTKKNILESRTKTSEKLLRIISVVKGRKPQTLISTSAVGFYGDSGEALVNEESKPGEGFLAETCVAWEDSVKKATVDRLVIFRLGMVLGRHGGALEKILPLFKKGVGGNLGSGKQWMSWIHIEDLVRMFLFAIENKNIRGVYNAVAPYSVRNSEFTQEISSQLEVPAFFPAPALGLKIILGEMSSLLLFSQNVSSKKIQEAGFEFYFKSLGDAFTKIFSCVEKKRGALFHEFVSEQWFPQPVEEIFPFFSDAKNLEAITPPFLQFKILNQSTPQLQEGTVLDYGLKIHGFPIRWRSMILDWKENQIFSDTQQKGPYSFWYHKHCFERVGKGTYMRDRVVYRLPCGYLGFLFTHCKVANDIRSIFSYRREIIFKKFWK